MLLKDTFMASYPTLRNKQITLGSFIEIGRIVTLFCKLFIKIFFVKISRLKKEGSKHTTLQIFGGMGLMEEMPIQRFWRDSRLERIWDGTSEIQRHIITRSILRPLGA